MRIFKTKFAGKTFKLFVQHGNITLKWSSSNIKTEEPEPTPIGEKFDVEKLLSAIPDGIEVKYFDAVYQHVDVQEVKKFLEKNRVSEKPYIKTAHDCENFAFKTWVDIQDWFGFIPFGVAIGQCSWVEGRHAWCVFFDNEWNMHMIEPQSDAWHTPSEDDEIDEMYI